MGYSLIKIDSSCSDGDGSVGFLESRFSKTVYKGADIFCQSVMEENLCVGEWRSG